VSGLVGGSVDAPNRMHEGLSETDVLLERLYALNIMGQAGYEPALQLWQVRRGVGGGGHSPRGDPPEGVTPDGMGSLTRGKVACGTLTKRGGCHSRGGVTY
jgi:hypothetical protein